MIWAVIWTEVIWVLILTLETRWPVVFHTPTSHYVSVPMKRLLDAFPLENRLFSLLLCFNSFSCTLNTSFFSNIFPLYGFIFSSHNSYPFWSNSEISIQLQLLICRVHVKQHSCLWRHLLYLQYLQILNCFYIDIQSLWLILSCFFPSPQSGPEDQQYKHLPADRLSELMGKISCRMILWSAYVQLLHSIHPNTELSVLAIRWQLICLGPCFPDSVSSSPSTTVLKTIL